MKIPNYLTIFLSALAIIVLLGLAGFVTYTTVGESNPFKQQVDEILHLDELLDEYLPGLSTAGTADESAPETQTEQSTSASVKEHAIVFVGDSRTIGMRDAVNDACTYLGAEGEGYHWFTEEGLTSLRELLGSHPAQKVVLNLGVNDPENISLYIDLYHELVAEFPQTSFYMLSVNPLDDNADFNTTNAMAELFNATMESSFPQQYLDSYSYLKENGFETVDGLHYTDATYQTIHNFVVNAI